MRFGGEWDDLLDVRIGPFGMGAFMGPRPFRVRYSRTSDANLLHVQISKEVEKGDIKVRFIEKGLIEIEWPRRTKGEEIPIE
jgi:hypothetical protein